MSVRKIILLTIICLTASYSTKAQNTYSKHSSITTAPYSFLDKYAYQPQTIKNIIRATAEFQLNKYADNIPTKDWLVGTFYSSFVAAYNVTGDKWFLNQAYNWGKKSEWDINKPINADDVCPGQTYLDLYEIYEDSNIYKTLDAKLSVFFNRTEILPGEKSESQKKALPLDGKNVWSWCDALYMAPPVYARMGKITGDKRYYEMLHRLYWDAVDFLYSEEDMLFHRNSKSQTEHQRTPNGKKVFWSRGNGWVFGGLARLINYLPDSDSTKTKYIELYQNLAFSLAKYQMEDGLWRSSLNDPAWIKSKETSGSAFFVYGMAKGINEGWLPKEYFVPIVLKGWSGLVSCVTPEGKLGYSQIVAGSPHEVRPHDSKDYAIGAFILAATEMLKMSPHNELNAHNRNIFIPRLVASDGAWTWYNDERVIFHNNIFFANYVKHNGNTAVTAFSVEKWSSCHAQKEKILSSWNPKDNHNNGALLPLKDGKILASYAKHGDESQHFYQRKITIPRWDECKLGEEKPFKLAKTDNGLIYQNLLCLSDENERLYNFFQGDNFNPYFVYSDDDAESWSKPIEFISAAANTKLQPYIKYVTNGKNRIDFLYADGTRNEKQNNIYHIYYQNGNFFNSKGKRLRSISEIKNKPIAPNEGTLVYNGNSDHCWSWYYDLEYDENGQLFTAFISLPRGNNKSNMRYWTAKLIGKRWEVEKIAYAGSNLSSGKQNYVGGVALHPHNSQQLVISTDVNPATGIALPNHKYQLFKGTKTNGKWGWKQLTFDPIYDHLGPVIVRGDKKALFWLTGTYRSHKNYETDIMMSYYY